MAAGLSLKRENIDTLRDELNKNCSLRDEEILPKVRIDRRIPIRDISIRLINQLEALEPFGKGNETPIFAEKNLYVDKFYIFGKDANVLKLNLIIDDQGRKMEAVGFGKVEEFKNLLKEKYGEEYLNRLSDYNFFKDKLRIDITFYPYINHYNGVDSIQLRISSFRLAWF